MKTATRSVKNNDANTFDISKMKNKCIDKNVYFSDIIKRIKVYKFVKAIENFMKYDNVANYELLFEKDSYKNICFMNVKMLDKIIAKTYYYNKYKMSMCSYICIMKENKFATLLEDVHNISKHKEIEYMNFLKSKYVYLKDISEIKIFFDFIEYDLYMFFSFDYIAYCSESKKILFIEYKNKKDLNYVVKSNIIQYAIFYEFLTVINKYLSDNNYKYRFDFVIVNDHDELYIDYEVLRKNNYNNYDIVKLDYYVNKFYNEYFCTVKKLSCDCYNYVEKESDILSDKINVLRNEKIIYKDKSEKKCITKKYIEKIIV